MAWGDPGGPSDSDMGGGHFGGMDGHGGFADSVATSGPGKGYGGGHSNTGGASGPTSTGQGLLGSELGTEGAGGGYGTGHASTDAGGSASGGTVRGPVRSERIGTQTMDFNSIATGAIASFASEVDAAPVDGFSGQVDARAMSTADQTAMAGQNIQSQAGPGAIGRTVATMASLANPMAGVAIDTAARGYNASQTAAAHNAEFGTSVDTGLASNIGRQAVATAGGLLGGRLGTTAGSRFGALTGDPTAALAGGLLGGMAGSTFGRSAALGEYGGSTPGPGMGADGPTGAPSPATMSPTTPDGVVAETTHHGPIDFDGYASYAASFFS